MSSQVIVKARGAVRRIVMNRPEKRNALTGAMYTGLAGALEHAASDPETRVVVLAGAGGAFTSGNDLGDFLAGQHVRGETPVARFLRTISSFPKPLVAQVSGPAIGVGTTMLLHCDLVYADTDAVFQLPFVNIGLVPEAASSLLLPRLAGHAKAAELLFFGAPFPAVEAAAIGLVNAVVAAEDLDVFVENRAEELAQKPAGALRATKQLLRRSASTDVQERMREEGALFADRLTSPEAREAMIAMLEKRKPDFSRSG
jgi:enoyl-CoA hydratase/carnithine racemase